MNIRSIAQNDFNQVHTLVCQVHGLHVSNRPDFYNDVDPFDKEYIEHLLNDEKTIALVAEDCGKIVGYCVFTIREPSKNPLLKERIVAYMEDLCVDENQRKLGIGQSLFEEAQRASKNRGANVLELMVWAFNTSAIHFYEKMGMTPRSYTMEKRL